jgi:hypothetical protein
MDQLMTYLPLSGGNGDHLLEGDFQETAPRRDERSRCVYVSRSRSIQPGIGFEQSA